MSDTNHAPAVDRGLSEANTLEAVRDFLHFARQRWQNEWTYTDDECIARWIEWAPSQAGSCQASGYGAAFEALRRIKYHATALSDAQVIALQALERYAEAPPAGRTLTVEQVDDALADACVEAEIPDSKFQSLAIALRTILAASSTTAGEA
jgi:hypothetical protein